MKTTMDFQKALAGACLAIVFIGMSAVLGWQMVHGTPIDPLASTAWGVLAGQYVKLLGVEQGTSVISKTLNGFVSAQSPPQPTKPPDPAAPGA